MLQPKSPKTAKTEKPEKPAKTTKKLKGVKKPKAVPATLQGLLALGLPEVLATTFLAAVALCRASGSATETRFVAWLVVQASKYARLDFIDEAGNVSFVIDGPSGKSKTLFIAHTDTVADQGGVNKPVLDGAICRVDNGWEVLGADDGAGIAILMYLMSQKVPGRYVFSRGEEIGGVGAKHLAGQNWLKNYKRAIAFDRRGTSEVISVQGGVRCASTEFSEALADALNAHEDSFLYVDSDKGIYTDTKEFRHVIPNCVNVATGYYHEHGPAEHQDLIHLSKLAQAAAKVDWENLPEGSRAALVDDEVWDFKHNLKLWRSTELEDAIYNFLNGYGKDLKEILAQRLAEDFSIDSKDAERHINLMLLTESKLLAAMAFNDENLTISQILDIVVVKS